MGIYKITRPGSSARSSVYGLTLKTGETLYLDDLKIAAGLKGAGWETLEVESVPKGYKLPIELPEGVVEDGVIQCVKLESLRKVMSSEQIAFKTKPKGLWVIKKPHEWTKIFHLGFDTRHPIETEDYDVMAKFAKEGFEIETIEGPKEPPKPLSRKRPGPLTTYSKVDYEDI